MSCTPATEFERLDLSLQSVGKLDHKIEEAQKRERGGTIGKYICMQ